VVHGAGAAAILQLGAPSGYAPLRQHLMEAARAEGVLADGDDLIVTSGCQQAFDLLARVLVTPGAGVAVEDPVYPGVKNVFERAGAELAGVPVGGWGIDLEAAARQFSQHRPKLAVVTPNFQNPTGATLGQDARQELLELAREHGLVLVENDIYGALRYSGEAAPPLKRMDSTGRTVLLRSFSKIAFPGLRVGWAIGPAPLIARMREAKQCADLHTDQLSQAVLLRFSESGRLQAHLARMLVAGAERLAAVLDACERYLPAGSSFSRPRGGMNLWVDLPAPLDSAELLGRAQRQGAQYLPSKFFTVSRRLPGGLRLSFAGLDPEQIREGVRILGSVFSSELREARAGAGEPAAAVV
jgi:DNA-binding transcriptional MocR family regulator